MKIQVVINNIQNLVLGLRQNRDGVWQEVNDQMNELLGAMTEFLKYIEELIQQGEEFPIEVVIQQMQNLNDAYSRKDYVLLADTLEYEIMNALYVYIEEREKRDAISRN